MLVLKVFKLVHERKVPKKDGTEFTIRYQEAEIVQNNKRPRVVEIPAPAVGRYEEDLYTLDAHSFRPDKYERLEMGFPKLVPLEEAKGIIEEMLKRRKSEKSV
jgi:hypothetical protein